MNLLRINALYAHIIVKNVKTYNVHNAKMLKMKGQWKHAHVKAKIVLVKDIYYEKY